MKSLIAILLITFCATSYADDWTGDDKNKHFAGSAAMGVAATVVFKDSEHPVLYPFAATIAVGLAKEVYDEVKSGGSGFSYKDLAADALGAALGVSVGNGVLYVTRNTVNYAGKW